MAKINDGTFEVDFERCLVVAIFRGEQVNVRGIEIASVFEAANSIVIRFDQLTYQTEGADNKKPPDRPYAFVVLAKTNKTIVMEEGLRQYINDPPVWKECARLEARRAVEQQNVKRQ